MKNILALMLIFTLLFSFAACTALDGGEVSEEVELQSDREPSKDDGEEKETSETNFTSTGGSILYHGGYTYFISGSMEHSSEGAAGSDGVRDVRDVYTVEFELLRISDDKSASAEVIHTFEMIMPQYMFFANGRIWFTEIAVDGDEGFTALSMGSLKPDGSDYKSVLSDSISISGTRVLGQSDGKLYFQERGEYDEAIYTCFDTKSGKWESLSHSGDAEGRYMLLTVAEGYAYYVKQAQVGGGNEIGLWRSKLADGTSELLTRLTEDEAASNSGRMYWATDAYFYYVSDYKVKAVSVENGDIFTVIEDTEKVYACHATNDGFYYLGKDGLYFTSISENKTELKLKSENSIGGYYLLAICGDWFVYVDDDTTQKFYRVKNTATQLPEAYFYREK